MFALDDGRLCIDQTIFPCLMQCYKLAFAGQSIDGSKHTNECRRASDVCAVVITVSMFTKAE